MIRSLQIAKAASSGCFFYADCHPYVHGEPVVSVLIMAFTAKIKGVWITFVEE